MPDYIGNLKIAEGGRYEGFDKYLECINQSQISANYKNVVETIAKVKAAVTKLLLNQKFTSIIENITDNKGLLKKVYENSLFGKIEQMVKTKKRVLNDKEIEEKIIEVAKEVEISEEEPDKECIEDVFNIDDFIVGLTPPPMTPQIKSNLQKIHSELLVPIMKYYKNSGEIPDDGICRLHILCGLASKSDIITYYHGTSETPHAFGAAVDFFIEGIDTAKIFKDICENKIDLNFGVIFNKGGSIHITIPYKKFKKFILSINSEVIPFTTGISFAGKVLGKLFN